MLGDKASSVVRREWTAVARMLPDFDRGRLDAMPDSRRNSRHCLACETNAILSHRDDVAQIAFEIANRSGIDRARQRARGNFVRTSGKVHSRRQIDARRVDLGVRGRPILAAKTHSNRWKIEPEATIRLCPHLRDATLHDSVFAYRYFVRIPQNATNIQDWINALHCVVFRGFAISNALLKNV